MNEEVIIRLKWGQTEYKGRLVSIDSYMNIQLSGAEEWIDQEMTSVLGQVLIRYVDCGREIIGGNGPVSRGKLMLDLGAIMYYGSKARIRTTGMETRKWRVEEDQAGGNTSQVEVAVTGRRAERIRGKEFAMALLLVKSSVAYRGWDKAF